MSEDPYETLTSREIFTWTLCMWISFIDPLPPCLKSLTWNSEITIVRKKRHCITGVITHIVYSTDGGMDSVTGKI